MSAWRYAWRRYARGWRSGELLILSVALTVGVGTSSAVGLFTDRVRAALAAQSGDTMGADLIVSARDALPDSLAEQARANGLTTVSVYSLPSVVFHGEASRASSGGRHAVGMAAAVFERLVRPLRRKAVLWRARAQRQNAWLQRRGGSVKREASCLAV